MAFDIHAFITSPIATAAVVAVVAFLIIAMGVFVAFTFFQRRHQNQVPAPFVQPGDREIYELYHKNGNTRVINRF